MNKARMTTVIALLALATGLAWRLPVLSQEPKRITVKGTVKSDDAKRAPILGVVVIAYRNDVQIAKDKTDKDGAYTLLFSSGVKIKLQFSHSAWNTLRGPGKTPFSACFSVDSGGFGRASYRE